MTELPNKPLHFIVGKLSDGEWHHCAGPASLEILERVLGGWQANTPSACIVTASRPSAIVEEPTGWKLVPVEITLPMQKAYFDVIDKNMERVTTDTRFGRFDSQQEAYRAMLVAAPPSPQPHTGRPLSEAMIEAAARAINPVAFRVDPPRAKDSETKQNMRESARNLAHAALNAALTVEPAHPDDAAVDRFAVAMKVKLAKKRAEGRGGWERKDECTAEFLSELLRGHVEKGDPLDVGNLAMMLHQRGERIAKVAP